MVCRTFGLPEARSSPRARRQERQRAKLREPYLLSRGFRGGGGGGLENIWGFFGFGVSGLGFGVWGLGFGVWGLGVGGLGFGLRGAVALPSS